MLANLPTPTRSSPLYASEDVTVFVAQFVPGCRLVGSIRNETSQVVKKALLYFNLETRDREVKRRVVQLHHVPAQGASSFILSLFPQDGVHDYVLTDIRLLF